MVLDVSERGRPRDDLHGSRQYRLNVEQARRMYNSEKFNMLPLLSIDESTQRCEEPGIDRAWATLNVWRGLLQSPSAAAGFSAVVNALMFHNKVAARARELIILRIGWRTGSEYVFCQHVRIS